jgi:tetratricopeptide (TPR) repeat protein
MDQLEEQVKTLQARVSADEAQPVPYSAAELAFFQPGTPVLAATTGPTKVENQPPTGADDLVASAKAHFADRDYDQAAADYRKILQLDKNNAYALANLATIELQQGHLTDAQKYAEAAEAQNANDPYTLSVLGNVKFQQGKYDEALDILSKGAALDPQNPTIESLLGVCYGHKGLRLQAETALRKAVLLDPNFAGAQYNLAVVYMGEQPPRAGLARYHYLKALAAGQSHNPDFEKLLADNGAGISAP